MTVKQYDYRSGLALRYTLMPIGGLLGLLTFVFVGGFFLVAGIITGKLLSILGIVGWAWLVGGGGGMALINTFPTVWLDDSGLIISAFLVHRVRIPWEDLVDIGAGHPPFGTTLVRARRITPYHRVYGWLWSWTLLPSFLIGNEIDNCEELLARIRRELAARLSANG